MLALHHDLGPADRFFWFTTTGWMMWNFLVSGPAVGAAIVLFDGNPAAYRPDLAVALWRLAAETGITYFGTSAPFLLACRKAGLVPREVADLSALRGVGSTGAPLPAEGFALGVRDGRRPRRSSQSLSGGTDVCTGFVGGVPLLPVYAGEIACRCLGAKVEAVRADGTPVIGELGELVITEPMPSMPVGLLERPRRRALPRGVLRRLPGRVAARRLDHHHRARRLRDHRPLRRHPQPRRRAAGHGRVLLGGRRARRGRRLGGRAPGGRRGRRRRAAAVRGAGRRVWSSTTRCARRIAGELRTALSPRHVPDEIHQVRAVPRTLSAKKLEVPVKRILTGTPVDAAAAKGALANPESLTAFAAFANAAAEPTRLSLPPGADARARRARSGEGVGDALRRRSGRPAWPGPGCAQSTTVAPGVSGASSQSTGSGWRAASISTRAPGAMPSSRGARPSARPAGARRSGPGLAGLRREVVAVAAYLDDVVGEPGRHLPQRGGQRGQRRARTARRPTRTAPRRAGRRRRRARPRRPASSTHASARPTSSRAAPRRSASAAAAARRPRSPGARPTRRRAGWRSSRPSSPGSRRRVRCVRRWRRRTR